LQVFDKAEEENDSQPESKKGTPRSGKLKKLRKKESRGKETGKILAFGYQNLLAQKRTPCK